MTKTTKILIGTIKSAHHHDLDESSQDYITFETKTKIMSHYPVEVCLEEFIGDELKVVTTIEKTPARAMFQDYIKTTTSDKYFIKVGVNWKELI